MIIRCPHCEHTRSISEGKIPAQAEYATCPKCRHRFLFRTLPRDVEAEVQKPAAAASAAAMEARRQSGEDRHQPTAQPVVLRPQEAFRESAEQRDIWDAMDALNQRWEAQLDQHVTEVEQPRPTGEPGGAAFLPDASPAPERPVAPPAPERRAPSAPPAPERPVAPQAPEAAASPASAATPAAPVSAASAATPAAPVSTASAVAAVSQASGRQGAALAAPQAGPGTGLEVPEPATPRPRFPSYGEDDPAPEERVEKDLEMLRAAPASRPTRDLGRLREFADAAQNPEAASEAVAETTPETASATRPETRIAAGIESKDEAGGALLHLPPPEATEPVKVPAPAWERPLSGRFAAFTATVRGVMLGGPGYFAGMEGAGSLVPGYLFFLLMGYICIICSLAWRAAAQALLPGLLPPLSGGLVLLALLMLAPAALGLMQLFVTGWIRLLLRLLVPEQADFGLVYKVVSYSVAPFVLSVVPFAGPLLGAAWFMAALASGCRGALKLSPALSILLPLPPAAMLLGAVAWFFL